MDSKLLTAVVGLITAVVSGIAAPLVRLFVLYIQRKWEFATSNSSNQEQSQPAAPRTAGSSQTSNDVIRLVSHSPFFYWWPVWFCGFVVALLTYLDDARLLVVPAQTRVRIASTPHSYLLDLPRSSNSLEAAASRSEDGQAALQVRAGNPSYGLLFTFIVILIVIIVHVPIRGYWSIVAVFLMALVPVMVPSDMWDAGFRVIQTMSINIDPSGYLFVSSACFALWIVLFFLLPIRTISITAREIHFRDYRGKIVCLSVAESEFTVLPQDLFLHVWIGLGAGDLVIRTSGGGELLFPNVLFIDNKVTMIKRLVGSAQFDQQSLAMNG